MGKTIQKTAELVKIYSAPDAINGEMIQNLLHNEGIECYRKELETGNYMNIYMGFSVFGEDIYVNALDEQAAREILQVLEPDEQDTEDESLEDDLNQSLPFYKNKRFVVWLLIAFFFGGTFLLYVLTYLANHGYF
jgi:hypothetical protein